MLNPNGLAPRTSRRADDVSAPAVNLLNENPSLTLSGSSPPRTRKRRYQWCDVITTHDGRKGGRTGGRRQLRGGLGFASVGSDGRTDGRTIGWRADGRRGSLRSPRNGRSDSGAPFARVRRYITSHHITSHHITSHYITSYHIMSPHHSKSHRNKRNSTHPAVTWPA